MVATTTRRLRPATARARLQACRRWRWVHMGVVWRQLPLLLLQLPELPAACGRGRARVVAMRRLPHLGSPMVQLATRRRWLWLHQLVSTQQQHVLWGWLVQDHRCMGRPHHTTNTQVCCRQGKAAMVVVLCHQGVATVAGTSVAKRCSYLCVYVFVCLLFVCLQALCVKYRGIDTAFAHHIRHLLQHAGAVVFVI